MAILDKITKLRRYSAFATGDFEKIFADLEVPPCPEVVVTLMEALDDPDIEIGEIVRILESDAALSARIISTANSALFSLNAQVSSISKAVSLLGLKEITAIALGYALVKTAADPQRSAFDMKSYWSDTLIRAVFAKRTAELTECGEPEEAFAGALFQDIAMPVIMGQWFDVYGRVFEAWLSNGGGLTSWEEQILAWTHAQAGAWIAGRWGLPDILVCAIGLHHSGLEEIEELGLDEAAIPPVALSALLPSALLDTGRKKMAFEAASVGEGSDPGADDSQHWAAHPLKELESRAEQAGIGAGRVSRLIQESAEVVEDLAAALGVRTAGTAIYREAAALMAEAEN